MAAIFLTRVNVPRPWCRARVLSVAAVVLPGVVLGLALYVYYLTTFGHCRHPLRTFGA